MNQAGGYQRGDEWTYKPALKSALRFPVASIQTSSPEVYVIGNSAIVFWEEQEMSRTVDTNRLQPLGMAIKTAFEKIRPYTIEMPESASDEEILFAYLQGYNRPTLAVLGKDVSPEIIEFLDSNRCLGYFERALQIIRSSFKEINSLEFRLEEDSDVEGSKWVCFDILTDAKLPKLMKCYDEFTEQFIEKIPFEVRGFFRISF